VNERHPLIDDVIEEWAAALGSAQGAYRGHAFRVFNIARQLGVPRSDELALASAFHDLGIWSDKTFDYLEPSIARAETYMRARTPGLSTALVSALIANHHKLRRIRDWDAVEGFRRADLVDVTRGWFRAGLDGAFFTELVAAFPYGDFHRTLVHTALAWWVRHPLRPVPVVSLGRPVIAQPT
jgi:hypothetical protein